jgi:hypothetical protein
VDGLAVEVDFESDVSALAGRRLFLEVRDPAGGAVPIASAPIEGPKWRLDLTDITQTTGLQPQEVSLQVSFGDQEPESTKLLFATVEGSLARLEVQVTRAPRVVAGQIEVEVALPIQASVLYPDRFLVLAVAMGDLAQTLGEWPIRGWSSQPRVLRAPVPGVPDGPLECGSVLRLSLR